MTIHNGFDTIKLQGSENLNAVEKYGKHLDEFRLMDDDFMSQVFDRNIEATQLVVDILLSDKKLKVKSVTSQREYKSAEGRTIKLDIYAEDESGIPIDIEIQRADKGAAPKRARFHSSMLDTRMLSKGEDFSELKETYVIFITENDVLKKGLPIYHIERTVKETAEWFGDGTHILYVNGNYTGQDAIGQLMHDFRCKKASEMHYEPLAQKVRYFKENEGGRETMCKIVEDLREEAREEARNQIAIRLLQGGKLSVEEIASAAELPLREVERIKKDLDKKKSS